jgi:hypothetical protein
MIYIIETIIEHTSGLVYSERGDLIWGFERMISNFEGNIEEIMIG